jgi:hypothetical protein
MTSIFPEDTPSFKLATDVQLAVFPVCAKEIDPDKKNRIPKSTCFMAR